MSNFRQFIVFCGVGVINTAVCLGLIIFLSVAYDMHHAIANVIGYAVGIAVGFTLHSLITFSDIPNQKPWRSRLKSFFIIFIVAYLLQFLFLLLMVDILHAPEILSQILSCGVYTVMGYLGNKLYTFQDMQKKPGL